MRYQYFDHCELPVSKIVLGSTYFGTTISEEHALTMLDRFVEHGGTTIDTARVYGQTTPGGPSASEQVIGLWMQKNGMRDKVVLATKGVAPEPSGKSRFSYKNLMLDIERSQDELRTDHFDFWFCHRDDVRIPVDEIMDMFAPLVDARIIRNLGASNWTVDRIEAANRYAEKRNLPRFVTSEIQWSLATSTPESWGDPSLVCMNDTQLGWYRKQGMPIFAYSSQAKGLFSKAIELGFDGLNEKSRQRFLTEENARRVERVKKLSEEMKVSAAAIAVGYITSERPASVAIVGCSSVDQLDDSLSASDLMLSPDQVAYLVGGENAT